MKKIETLAKTLVTISTDELKALVNCKDIDAENLTENEKFSVLIFNELNKALETKEYYLTLDCNYSQSKKHDSGDFLVDYYRLVSKDTKNQSMIQFYVSASAKKQTVSFNLCTSCAKCNREQFIQLEDKLHFNIKRDKKTGRAKTSERQHIRYAEIVDTVKAVCAVLANKTDSNASQTAQSAENAKAESQTA